MSRRHLLLARAVWSLLVLAPVAMLVPHSAAVAQVPDAEVQAAIKRGVDYLFTRAAKVEAGESGLLAYTLLKQGESGKDPRILSVLNGIKAKVQGGQYQPLRHHVYEAAVDVMALEADDPAANAEAIQAIGTYLLTQQKEDGQWFYPERVDTGGDTSITQYALLGLWAAQRAGVEVPNQVWEKAALWFVNTQLKDGGFAYHPGNLQQGQFYAAGHTMVAAGVGSLHLIRMLADPRELITPTALPTARFSGERKYSVLEPYIPEETPEDEPEPEPIEVVEVTRQQIDGAIKNGTEWLLRRWPAEPGRAEKVHYYLYGIERLCAISDQKKFGPHDWYQQGSTFLVRTQARDGSWLGTYGTVPDSCFALLFLSRATGSIVRPKAKPRVAGGLLASGRGLPDDLSQVDISGGKVEARRKPQGPVDELLAVLEKAEDTDVAAAQASIIEVVQLDQPEALVEQTDRLVRLIKHPHVEVRRTAAWALGRTRDIGLARLLVEALDDPALDVAIEAHNALCVLSRQPAGLGLPATPDALVESERGTDPEQSWRKVVGARWREWYLRNRPYSQRNDRYEVVAP